MLSILVCFGFGHQACYSKEVTAIAMLDITYGARVVQQYFLPSLPTIAGTAL